MKCSHVRSLWVRLLWGILLIYGYSYSYGEVLTDRLAKYQGAALGNSWVALANLRRAWELKSEATTLEADAKALKEESKSPSDEAEKKNQDAKEKRAEAAVLEKSSLTSTKAAQENFAGAQKLREFADKGTLGFKDSKGNEVKVTIPAGRRDEYAGLQTKTGGNLTEQQMRQFNSTVETADGKTLEYTGVKNGTHTWSQKGSPGEGLSYTETRGLPQSQRGSLHPTNDLVDLNKFNSKSGAMNAAKAQSGSTDGKWMDSRYVTQNSDGSYSIVPRTVEAPSVPVQTAAKSPKSAATTPASPAQRPSISNARTANISQYSKGTPVELHGRYYTVEQVDLSGGTYATMTLRDGQGELVRYYVNNIFPALNRVAPVVP